MNKPPFLPVPGVSAEMWKGQAKWKGVLACGEVDIDAPSEGGSLLN